MSLKIQLECLDCNKSEELIFDIKIFFNLEGYYIAKEIEQFFFVIDFVLVANILYVLIFLKKLFG